MMIKDAVYGSVKIKEDVIVELIASKKFQRLKGICQQGVPKEYTMKMEPGFYRYDHCIGTMLILRRLNASLEEQVAGLLHDVSHTAFSHVVDYIFGGGSKEDYQDSIHHTYFSKGAELARILEKHGFDAQKISRIKNYGLLEQDQPEMCADRFDYTIRYWASMKDSAFIKTCLDSITTFNNIMVFNSRKAAQKFAKRHMVWQPEWKGWGGTQYDMRIRWYIFGEALRLGIKNGIITKDDFMKTDNYVVDKLLKANDRKITKLLDVLKKQIKFKTANNKPKLVLYSKFRYVDPKFLEDGKLKKLSDVDKQFRIETEEHRKLNKAGIKLSSIEGIEVPIK